LFRIRLYSHVALFYQRTVLPGRGVVGDSV
jgi:hypothetical protein